MMFGTPLPNPSIAERTIVRVCCHCRRVRTADGWKDGEVPASLCVSHGICRQCFEAHYPEFCPAPTDD